MFNKHFLTLSDKVKLVYIDINSALSFLQSSFPNGFPKMVIIPITEAELMSTISSLKSENSSGYQFIK